MKTLLLSACLLSASLFAEEKPTVDQQPKNEIKATLGKVFTDLARKDLVAFDMLFKIIENNWYGNNFSLVVGKNESALIVTESKEDYPFKDMREGVHQAGWFGTRFGYKQIKPSVYGVRYECNKAYGEDKSLCKMLWLLNKTLDEMKEQRDLTQKQRDFNNSYVEKKATK